MRLTPATARRYLTDEAVRDLARTVVLTVADEAPGADVLAWPPTAAVPVSVMGRCIAGLSGAIMLRLAERDDLDHVRTTTAQLAQALSALGQVIAEHCTGDTAAAIAGPVVLAPPALLNRAARYLQAAAAMVPGRQSLARPIRRHPRSSACRHIRDRRARHALLQRGRVAGPSGPRRAYLRQGPDPTGALGDTGP